MEEYETRIVPKVKGFYFSKYVEVGKEGEPYLADQPGFWRAWEAGEIVPKSSADYRAWAELGRDTEELRRADPWTRWGLVPARAASRPWTFVTSLFLHGDWFHLLFNMLFLYLVGCNIEYRWGIFAYVVFYLLGGTAAGMTQGMRNWSSEVPCIGASGAIAALMGAFLVRHAKAKVRIAYLFWSGFSYTRYGTFRLPAWAAIGLWFLGQAWLAPVAEWLGSGALPIAVWAHIGGFLFGVGVAFAVRASPLEKWVEERRMQSSGYVPPPEKAELESGLKFLEAGHPMQALGFLRQAVEREPANQIVRGRFVDALLEAGSQNETRSEIEKLVAAAKIRGDRGAVAAKVGSLLDRYPEESLDPGPQYLAARWLEEAGDLGHACIAYRNLAVVHPDHALAAKALFRAGEIQLEKLGQPQAGEKCLRTVLSQYPESPLCPLARERLESGGRSRCGAAARAAGPEAEMPSRERKARGSTDRSRER